MSDIVIRAENIGKLYKLGEIGTGTISHDLNRWWAKVRGKEDPFAKIGEINDRTSKGENNWVWALRDINFEVRQGEVLGIIGRNGAGKSTLLKILSKVTTPTTGKIKVKGRIASLLEVGTGFHQELTGRENIFLNGAILGMSKSEVKSKFDEIVDFAGVERYIDTPVKRYSSGMFVRLAFAVAAFLEPEIMIVDEVLAVGDAEFQKKCLGRMKDVSNKDGRTVLFVSHNMAAVESLCNRGIVLDHGYLARNSTVSEVINYYHEKNFQIVTSDFSMCNRTGNGEIRFIDFIIDGQVFSGKGFSVCLDIEAKTDFPAADFAMVIKDISGNFIATLYTKQSVNRLPIKKGASRIKCEVEKLPIISGLYFVDLWCSSKMDVESDYIQNAFQFEVLPADVFGTGFNLDSKKHGSFIIANKWKKHE